MFLGGYMKKSESMVTEFKEFCLKLPIEQIVKQERIKGFYYNPKIHPIVESHIHTNLEYYFNYYVPKYISSFSNAPIKKGKLFIGVNDNGEITGIPSKYIDKQTLYQFLQNTKHMIHISNNNNSIDIDEYYSKIRIKLHKLQISELLLKEVDIYSFINHIDDCQQKYRENREKFEALRENWVKKLYGYSKKIVDFTNDPEIKKEMLDWLTENNCPKNILNILQNTDYIPITSDDIFANKYDNTHFIYWVLLFRDNQIREILKQKPVWEFQESKVMYYSLLINKLEPMRRLWLANNPDLNYYLIEITIPGGNCYKDHTFYYKRDSKLLYSERKVLKKGIVGCESEEK